MAVESKALDDPKSSLNYQWIIFTLLSSSHLLMAMCYYSWGPLAPTLKGVLDISNSQFGYIISLMYLAMVVVSAPSGFLVDHYGVKRMLFLSCFLVGSGMSLLAAKPSYTILVATALLMGIGYGMINQITTKGFVYWFEAQKRGTVMGIKQMGVTIGGSLIGIYIPFFSIYMGWQHAVLVLGLIVVAVSLICLGLYKEKPTEDIDLDQAGDTANSKLQKTSLREVMMEPKLVLATILASLLAFCQACLTSFLVLYAQENFIINNIAAGSMLTIAMVGGTFGRIILGMVSDRMLKGDRAMPLAIIGLIGVLSSFPLLFIGSNTALWILYIIAAFLGISFMGWNSLAMVLVAEMVGPDKVGSVLGIVFMAAWGAMVAGPALFGRLVDMGGYAAAWLMVMILSGLACAGFLFMARHYKPQS